jgi:hypothetical protein
LAGAGAGVGLAFLIAALPGACFVAAFWACFAAAGFDFAAIFCSEVFAGAAFLAPAGFLAVVCLEADVAGEAFATFLEPVCFDTVLGFEADALGALTLLAVALFFGDVAFPALGFFADNCTFVFTSFLVVDLALVDVLAFEGAIFLPVVFAFDAAGLLVVDLAFEAVGLDVAVFFPAGLAVFLVVILLFDFAFGVTALLPAAFVVDLAVVALVADFALVTPLFFVDDLVAD